jgi:acetyl esterase/lipase
MTRALIAICLLALFAAPPRLTAQTAAPEPSITRVYREVAGRSLRAHIFLPPKVDKARPTNAILLFHGGGWSVGSPDWTFAAAKRFAEFGLVAVAIEYRLSTGTTTPIDALDDVCEALAWIRTPSADFGRTGRVAGYGVSAGGHLVAAAATIGCPNSAAAPDALLLWSPALDVVNDGWFTKLLQGRGTAEALSPARHVGSRTPPTSIVHGERDTLTPVAGVKRYCAALTALKRQCELHVYPGLGHLLTRNLKNQESDFDPDPVARADGIDRHQRFLTSLGFVGGMQPPLTANAGGW